MSPFLSFIKKNNIVVLIFLLIAILSPLKGFSKYHEGHNWAIVLSSSRFWHNYRHTANALYMYHVLNELGLTKDRQFLFLGELYVCDSRNIFPGRIFGHRNKLNNLFNCDVKPDFTGYESSPFLLNQVLQGRYIGQFFPTSSLPNHLASMPLPPKRRLMSSNTSNIVIYINGHGNKGFLKFHDGMTLTTEDLANSIAVMHSLRMYNKVLLLVDTCKAESMCLNIRSPNVVCIASSRFEEESYSNHGDETLGISIIDNFVHELMIILEKEKGKSINKKFLSRSLHDIFTLGTSKSNSLKGAINDPEGSLHNWTLGEFFGPGIYYSYEGINEGNNNSNAKNIFNDEYDTIVPLEEDLF